MGGGKMGHSIYHLVLFLKSAAKLQQKNDICKTFCKKMQKKEKKVSRREGTATIKHTTYMDETKKQYAQQRTA